MNWVVTISAYAARFGLLTEGVICRVFLAQPALTFRKRSEAALSLEKISACPQKTHRWRGGRVAEGARLESVYTGNRIEGSNPSLSASCLENACSAAAQWDDHEAKAVSDDDLKAELERLRRENETLKKGAASGLRLKVSEKGALSVYGMGRFPVTLYKEQWLKLLDISDEIRAFIAANEGQLKSKNQD